ncbi:hypothetical protein [Paenibacillus apiarius]|uniref:hypothetical protein n=1 Tax=Paenibacillus apiarius TaxID=46240 RepID=UPI00198034B4|nr:hypothetical protein [Paenibacillus apiarius]MBN3524030.1 hypothetical protein [Paenibacillus apiarius]
MRKTILAFVVVMLCISSTVFANENMVGDELRVNKRFLSKDEEVRIEKRSEEVGNYFLAVAKARAKLDQISEQHLTNSNSFLASKAELEELEKGYERLGLIRVDKGDNSVTPLSTRADYEIDKLTIYYDSKVNMHVIEMAGMWQNTNFYNDAQCPAFCSGTINVGGRDGIGLFSLHRDINVFAPKFYTLTHGTLAETDWSYRANDPKDARGAGFYFDDTVQVARVNPPKFEKYNAYRHLMWYYFNFTDGYPPSGTTISFKASVGHTWASNYVSSISVGPWSVGITFDKSYDNWLREKVTYMSF